MGDYNNRSALPVKEPPNCNDGFPLSESMAPSLQLSLENASVKPEPQMSSQPDLPLTHIPSDIPDPSDVLDEVHQLDSLSSSIHIFKRRFDELKNHLDFIAEAIEARFKELAETAPIFTTIATMARSTGIINAQSKTQANPEMGLKEDKKLASNEANLRQKTQTSGGDVGGSIVDNELKSLCKLMSGRGLRKYLVSQRSNTPILKEEVPLALTIAPNPAKLVLECVGRFYLQGSKAYSPQHSHIIAGRDAAILVLECFLLSGCAEKAVALDFSVRDEAKTAAITWRNRLVSEGGVSKVGEIDARGLLMLIASFGIPVTFKDEELTGLIRVSNARESSHVLRKSHALRERIPGIIGRMMKKGLIVEAVDIAYTLGYEEKFSPQKILTSFLQKSEEAWKKARQEGTGSFQVLEAYEKHLAALKSVLKCLEGHKIDWTEFLPEREITETIANLKTDISDLKKRMEEKALLKRKVDKIESSNKLEILETKRSNFITAYAKTKIYDGLASAPVSPSATNLHGYRTAAYEAGRSSHNDSVATNMYESARHSSHLNYYPVPLSAQMGTGVSARMGVTPAASIGYNGRSLHDDSLATNMYDDAGHSNRLNYPVSSYAQMGTGVSARMGVTPASSSNLRYNGDMEIDHVRMRMDHNSSSRWYVVEEAAACNDRSGNHSTNSDLYHFADAVVEDRSVERYDPSRGWHLPTTTTPHYPYCV